MSTQSLDNDTPASHLRRSHPAQYGETFDWSANLIA